jgi:hypothetical protein
VAATDIHAVACAVPKDARDLVLPDRFEYADAFVVALPPGTRIAAEDWARAMFMPRGLAKRAFAGAWNAVMGLEPPPNGRAMGPFELASAKRESAILVGEGERYRIRLVVGSRRQPHSGHFCSESRSSLARTLAGDSRRPSPSRATIA